MKSNWLLQREKRPFFWLLILNRFFLLLEQIKSQKLYFVIDLGQFFVLREKTNLSIGKYILSIKLKKRRSILFFIVLIWRRMHIEIGLNNKRQLAIYEMKWNWCSIVRCSFVDACSIAFTYRWMLYFCRIFYLPLPIQLNFNFLFQSEFCQANCNGAVFIITCLMAEWWKKTEKSAGTHMFYSEQLIDAFEVMWYDGRADERSCFPSL